MINMRPRKAKSLSQSHTARCHDSGFIPHQYFHPMTLEHVINITGCLWVIFPFLSSFPSLSGSRISLPQSCLWYLGHPLWSEKSPTYLALWFSVLVLSHIGVLWSNSSPKSNLDLPAAILAAVFNSWVPSITPFALVGALLIGSH